MARIELPSPQSDDEFDLVYPVSESSESPAPIPERHDAAQSAQHNRSSNSSNNNTHQHPASSSPQSSDGAERLSGPHEIPVLPQPSEYGRAGLDADEGEADDVGMLSQQFTGHSLRGASTADASVASPDVPQRGQGSIRDRVSTSLQYTKSVYNKFWEKDALIAVMGMTGSGKTTFISKVTGRTDLQIGHSLTSCTRDIQVVETKIDGQIVRFVDTPGFSDTTLSDTEVLELIADYLAAAYRKEMKLTGIIYVHPISDTRVTHHTTKNLDMLRKLTGEKNLSNVILATSMWDKVDPADGERREDELKSKFWKLLLALGAKTARHHGTPASAAHIAELLLRTNRKPFYLQLQEEMGRENKPLRDTAAGREVMLEIERIKGIHQRELQGMQELIKSSARESEFVIEAMREEHQRTLGDLQRVLNDERRMNSEAMRSMHERIQELERRGGGCNVM
ncbi:P-loop containing nucleoside triphosphate hydrolase protein [Coniella lustricola]|uniref:P-loop containing nucleoside triphosphate hydrolase protein n=1 Tax=Coniella lustricola TaxID=2025994 RepID=A0A2T3AJJ1_9PEZI|nr:P-loop containing nucleoside triphosphate hydrolase protein [Coniella lustricola]